MFKYYLGKEWNASSIFKFSGGSPSPPCLSQAYAGGPLSCTSQPHFNPIGHQAVWFVSLLRQFFGVHSYYSLELYYCYVSILFNIGLSSM